ncbi:MAG: hypothetical protein HQK53_09470 [Oligoflexia bacterium]|nr:hypothetical protein [Oligoflexia bacterium]
MNEKSMGTFRNYWSALWEEARKAFSITKKMLSASKTTVSLNNAYRDLGILLTEAIRKKELIWDHPKVSELLAIIDRYNSDLIVFEEQVHRIKFGVSAGRSKE